jgi:protein-S-isoprenylcysteine O-methyltransferase Ste14
MYILGFGDRFMLLASGVNTSKIHRAVAVAYCVMCHTLFAVGVGTMIAAMFFGMSRSFGRVSSPWSLLANALLQAQFPFLHSVLLSPFGALALRRLAPDAIASWMVTTTYAAVASVQVLLLFALWTPSGVTWWRAEDATLWLMTGLYAMAWLLLVRAIWDAGLAFQTGFLGWWAVANDRAPLYPPMPTTGLFRIVRQPIYVAFALTLWTVPTWTPDQLAVALVLTTYCLFGPLLKEKRFRERFGRDFLTYASRVPYWSPWPRPPAKRNDLSIYGASADWWSSKTPWLRTLQNLVPAHGLRSLTRSLATGEAQQSSILAVEEASWPWHWRNGARR